MARGCSKQGFQPLFMLLVIPFMGEMYSKDDMGPHLGGLKICLVCSCFLPEPYWDADEGLALRPHTPSLCLSLSF